MLATSQACDLDRKQLITLYMAIGGIPKYLNFIVPGKSVAQLLNEHCFHAQGFMFHEFSKLYRSLFQESENHMRVIRALGKKRYGVTQGELFQLAKLPVSGGSTEVLQELEECGFIMSFPEYGKQVKGKHWRLIDEYSLFYLTWIETMRKKILKQSDPEYWMKMQKSPEWLTWAGYAFENVCLKHVAKIKQALGLGGVSTVETQWSVQGTDEEEGAQIDLVIDRADGCINLCEIRFYKEVYVVTKQDKADFERKKRVFQEVTGTKKTLFTTLITPYGSKENEHYLGTVQEQLTMDVLF